MGKKSSSNLLLKPGNVGLVRLLIIVKHAGPKGITTYRLLKALGSIGRAQGYIKRAEREGLIVRKIGNAEHGHFPVVTNYITPRGKELLKNLSAA